MSRYQNSECRGEYLHKYKILSQPKGGLFERCERCGDKQFFPVNTPNHIYISYHIRQALQTSDPAFYHEYPNAI